MLSDRRQRVLAALIHEYVLHAIPVGSRTLVDNYDLGVSPATVRNELSVLESSGYVSQPHTSAGRVPTDYGYRAFVDDLLKSELKDESYEDESMKKAVADLRQSANELDSLMQKTTSALARLTDCLSIVLPPSMVSLHLRQVSLISMSDTSVLVVVVTEDGHVFNRNVEFHKRVSADELARTQSLLNRTLSGKSFKEMRDEIDQKTANELASPLTQALMNVVFDCLQTGEKAHAHHLGLSTLVKQPEFQQSQALMPVLKVLEDDTVMLELMRQTDDGATTVRIGHENDDESLEGVSLVASRYRNGGSDGIVAVIGPTRMDYRQVIKAVRTAKQALQDD